MDKQTESREQFEAWMSDNWKYPRAIEKTGDSYAMATTITQWEAWQASRASIVVDTPPLCGDGENDTEYTEGYNDGITATEKTIRSIGLSIKWE